jgi:hypothetical protein
MVETPREAAIIQKTLVDREGYEKYGGKTKGYRTCDRNLEGAVSYKNT